MAFQSPVLAAEVPDFFSDQAEGLQMMDVACQDKVLDFNQEFHYGNGLNDTLTPEETLPPRISDLNLDEGVRVTDPVPAERSMRATRRLGARRRAKIIPEHIWNKYKTTIEHLYIERDLTLAGVRLEMIASHGFDASEPMYKKRLHDWKSRKYYSQAQKKEAILFLTHPDLENQSASMIALNGKPLEKQRLYRRVQCQRKCFSIATNPDHVVRRAMKHYHRLHRTGQVQRHIFQQSVQSQNIEHFLRCAHRYYTWYKTRTEFNPHIGTCTSLGIFYDGIHAGFMLLKTNPVNGFAVLNRSCSEVSSILIQQPFEFLLYLVDVTIYRKPLQDDALQVWRSLLRFVASSADSILGTSHPITECITTILNSDPDSRVPLLTTFTNLYVDIVQTMPESSEKFALLREAVEVCSSHNINSDFVEHLFEKIESMATSSTQPTQAQKAFLQTIIMSRYSRCEYATCEKTCHKQMELSAETEGSPVGDHRGVFACLILGHVCFALGRYDESESLYKLAVKGYNALSYSFGALSCLVELERLLIYRGKDEEIARLYEEYADIVSDLDKWKLDAAQSEF